MLITPRLRAALRYLREADAPYRWRISAARCPNCQGRYFISLRPDGFMTRCLHCGANGTNLSLIPVIAKHQERAPIGRAWEMSTYGATLNYLQRICRDVVTSEYFPGREPGEMVNGILNQDVQRTSFESASLDLISSSQVFEHVADDLVGYAECHRILRPNGALVFSVPLYDIVQTQRIAEIVDGHVVHYGEPEYHDSRASGPHSVLTFWHHSVRDICARVAHAGFEVNLVNITLAPAQRVPTPVVYAVKAARAPG